MGCDRRAREPKTTQQGRGTVKQEPPSATDILLRSASALAELDAVAYDFEWGGPESPSGWATGLTRMRRVTDVSDSWIRVEGRIHPQPLLGVRELVFAYTFDGRRAWAKDDEGASWRTAAAGAGANGLAANAVFGFLPEFVEAKPLWKETGPMASARLLGQETLDGEICDMVEVRVQPPGGSPSLSHWSIARRDGLPRRAHWPASNGASAMTFNLSGLRLNPPLAQGDFQIRTSESPEQTGAPSPETVALGAPAPPFTLETSDGDTLSLQDLEGQVVVLEFWNTWCYLCRAMAPETHGLANDFAGRPVRFLGVNVFETADPLLYWRESGAPYPTLLAGDSLSLALDLPWQPGAAVLSPEGQLLWTQLGASHDRSEKIRRVVEDALSQANNGS